MDDLTAMLTQVLSDPDSMKQIQEVAASLGLGGGNDAPPAAPALPPPQEAAQPARESPPAGIDMNALSSLLQGLGGAAAQPAQPEPAPAAPALDTAALSSLLQNLAAGAPAQQPPAAPAQAGGVDLSALSGLIGGIAGKGQSAGGGADLSALTALLGAGQPQQAPQQGGGLPFDMNTLLKLQKAMSSMGANKANVDLLMALKPRLKEKRAKKVDDAVRVMQLIQFLPLIKESGLFGDGEGGGLGGIVGGIGDGINNVLGGLLGGLGGGKA